MYNVYRRMVVVYLKQCRG